ncbi:XK-related protein 6-like [Paramacrobiotus metropolitanus]|uniref:XK-related protein 6-like n=1 Tax=Paramacrobiotus metropolitanus TaxID=2943436 RepID=UPI002445819A|nr:XK-related protein 6-like [Paramacrobiotus metropolitanus]
MASLNVPFSARQDTPSTPSTSTAFRPNPFVFPPTGTDDALHPADSTSPNSSPDSTCPLEEEARPRRPSVLPLEQRVTSFGVSPGVVSVISDGGVVENGRSTVIVRTPAVEMAPYRTRIYNERLNDGVSSNPYPRLAPSRPKYERMHSGRLPVPSVDPDAMDALPIKKRYRIRDMILTGWAMITYIADIVSDWFVAVGFYNDNDIIWFALTVTFILVPHLCMTGFSLIWYIQDHKHHPLRTLSWRDWIIRIIVLFLQLAPIMRYIDSLRYGYKFRNSSAGSRLDLYELLCFENADAAMLRLVEAFMEAAPQLVLQIYILVKKRLDYERFDLLQTVQIVSIFISWFSLATAMAAFHRAQRYSQPTKGSMSICGSLMQLAWHLCIFASRVIAIALFTVRFTYFGIIFCGVHILVMIVWIISQKTDFCPNKPLEACYDVAVGCIYLFAFLNVKDARTRWKYVGYYTVYYVENVVMITLWFTHTENVHWFRVPAMVAVIVGFWVGIGFMLLYYQLFHPADGVLVRKWRMRYAVAGEEVGTTWPKWFRAVVDCCL